MASLVEFRARFPEFSSLEDAVVQYWLDDVVSILNEQSWGECYNRAVLLRSAHELALSQLRAGNAVVSANGSVIISGGAGAITSSSVDGVSVSFAVPTWATDGSKSDAVFAQTPYGQQYMQLRDTCLAGGMLAGTVPVDVI